ncbi:MAG TPA: HEAT repeat domain-containing protein [Bryobacteraceae bacterium]|nr:HEAT repeat domain-containing protein [Bryobacteraceae bacterium]
MLIRSAALLLAGVLACLAQDAAGDTERDRARAARELGKGGAEGIPQLAAMLTDTSEEARIEAVRAIVGIGTQHSLDPLITATRDNSPEVQVTATDGIVNFYLPGYVQSGTRRVLSSVRGRFDRENTQVIEPWITVRPEAIAALGRLVRGGVSMDARANAARAIGILRGRSAVSDLTAALQTKDDNVIFESLIALQKIGDPAAGPNVVFLVRDLNERVQVAAIDAAGLLKAKEAVSHLHGVFDNSRSDRVRRSALTALSMIGDPASQAWFTKAANDRNDQVRASAFEGFARLQLAANRQQLETAFNEEKKMAPRLAAAFALSAMGNREVTEMAPLRSLANALNSRGWRGVAQPYLVELSRDPQTRAALLTMLPTGTRDEKTGLLSVLAATGDAASAAAADKLTKDADSEVAQAAIRTVRTIRSRQ